MTESTENGYSDLTPETAMPATWAAVLRAETAAAAGGRFAQQNNLLGLVGAGLALHETTGEAEAILKHGPEFHGKEEAKERFDSAMEQTKQHRYTGEQNEDPDQEDLETVSLTGQLILAAAAARVNQVMVKIMQDPEQSMESRWTAFALAQGMMDESPERDEIERCLGESRWEKNPETARTLRQMLPAWEEHPGNPDGEFRAAGLALCRESGIDNVSDELSGHTGVIKDMAILLDRKREHQFSLDTGLDDQEFEDVVLFTFEGQTWLKRIEEPFPQGVGAEQAARIAAEYLEECREQEGEISRESAERRRNKGLGALKAATLGLHRTDNMRMTMLLEAADRLTEGRFFMPKHILRVLTGRDAQVEELLLRGWMGRAPLVPDNEANRIIKAARRGGLDPASTWELASLLQVDPDRYGVKRPELEEEIIEELAELALGAGIPPGNVEILRSELAGSNEEQQNPEKTRS